MPTSLSDHPCRFETAGAGPVQPPAFDPAIAAELEACFGPVRLRDLLGCLRDEIATRLPASVAGPATLEQDAHVLVSASGTLGFLALSQACAELCRACREGVDPTAALAGARRAARHAREAIDGMLAGAA